MVKERSTSMMFDKGGRPYRVDEKGFRKFHRSPRPDKFTPKEWQRIPHEKRKETIKAQEMESDAAVEKRKLERKVKEAEDKALKKLEESKKKEDKKASRSKDKPKKKDKDHDAGVSVKQDHDFGAKMLQIACKSEILAPKCNKKHANQRFWLQNAATSKENCPRLKNKKHQKNKTKS